MLLKSIRTLPLLRSVWNVVHVTTVFFMCSGAFYILSWARASKKGVFFSAMVAMHGSHYKSTLPITVGRSMATLGLRPRAGICCTYRQLMLAGVARVPYGL
uniref:Uncharacterized protein n=1 Tax=Anopheles maculatus TaxID=74869 RepID=A0A182SH21_9DIPT